MAGAFTLEQVRETYKPRDAWWTVFLVDPLASRLVKVTANRTSITPNQLTVAALVLGLVSAGLFWTAESWSLIAGAVVFYLAFALDCMDGKIARLKGTGSLLGSWLDYIFDRIRFFVCALALFGGQYRETERPVYLVLATVVVFLSMFRQMNAMQMAKVADSTGVRASVVSADSGAAVASGGAAAASGGAVGRVSAALLRHRVRPHLFSGIEFEMFVFIVGPLTLLILPVTVLACVLLLVFEVAVVAKLVAAARDADRRARRV